MTKLTADLGLKVSNSNNNISCLYIYIVAQFDPWFKFDISIGLGYWYGNVDNEFERQWKMN